MEKTHIRTILHPEGDFSTGVNFCHLPNPWVLVVDDILTRGGSVRDVISAVTKEGGRVMGVGVLVDRSDQPVDFGVPLFSCHRATPPPTYEPQDCPLCAAQVPLVKPGGSAKP